MKINPICQNCKFKLRHEIKYAPGRTETRFYCKKKMKMYGFKQISEITESGLKECSTGSHNWCAEWKEFTI